MEQAYFITFVVWFICSFVKPVESGVVRVQVVTLGVMDIRAGAASLLYHGAIIDEAIEDLQATYRHVFNLTHTYVFDKRITNCVEMAENSDNLLSKWFYQQKIEADMYAFISPTCIDEININRLMVNWNMIMITTVASDSSSRNKILSPTRVIMSSVSITSYAQMVCALMRKFGWTSLYVVFDENSLPSYPVMLNAFLGCVLRTENVQMTIMRINTKVATNYKTILADFRVRSRVLIFFGNGEPLRELLIQAATLNMTNGEFVYVACEFYRGLGTFPWKLQNSEDLIAREAFRSLLLFTFENSENTLIPDDLLLACIHRSLHHYIYVFHPSSVPLPAIIATFNAIIIFGQVLNETIVSDPTFDLTNGRAFASRFFNRTFMGLNNTKITLDAVGERQSKLLLNDFNYQTGFFEPVMYQDGSTLELHELDAIDWGSLMLNSKKPPPNEPPCGYQGERIRCFERESGWDMSGITIGSTLSFVAITSAVGLYVTRRAWKKHLRNGDRWWDLDYWQLVFVTPNQKHPKRASEDVRRWKTSLPKRRSILPISNESGRVRYKSTEMWADSFPTRLHKILTGKLKTKKLTGLFRQLSYTTSNKNINSFFGICISPETNFRLLILSGFCQRGSLHDLFERSAFLHPEQCSSLGMDFLEGMRFIHSSPFDHHGHLTGLKCLIDGHFTLKIAQLGFQSLTADFLNLPASGVSKPEHQLYWTAPEILRKQATVSKITDMYSVGVILYEIMTASAPYKRFAQDSSPGAIIRSVRNGVSPPFRPDVDFGPYALPSAIRQLISNCWNENPGSRPTIQEALQKFRFAVGRYKSRRKNLVDNMLSRLDGYAEGLEMEIRLRTDALLTERQKCDDLLCEMLPRTIVDRLRTGLSLPSEMFDSTTVMFCDFHGFTEFSAGRTPLEVTNLLNTLYSVFDPVLSHFDVYKVETIGSVYMVASGVPIRNGNTHVKEISLLSLALYSEFLLLPETLGVFFQAGIHSGPCAAGVIGHKNPRYCLFGDTINTASRMASYGAPNKIHISSWTAEITREFPCFKVTQRGQMEIKGKGIQTTFWLESI